MTKRMYFLNLAWRNGKWDESRNSNWVYLFWLLWHLHAHPSSYHVSDNNQASVLMRGGRWKRLSTTTPNCFLRKLAWRERERWCLFVEPVNFLISLPQTPTVVKGRMCVTQMSLSLCQVALAWALSETTERPRTWSGRSTDDNDDNEDSRGCDDNDHHASLLLTWHYTLM